MTPEQIAALYHLHHLQYTEDLPFWLALADQAATLSDSAVLELGCGTGRVLLALADAGVDMIGIDNDAAMLSVLHQQLAAQPRNHVTVIESDFTEAQLDDTFALVILPCNTYSTLDTPMRGKLLAQLQRWLIPGGAFVAGLPNPALLDALEPESEPEMELALDLPDEDATLAVSSGWEREGDWLRLDWVYDVLHADGRVERGGASTRHSLTPWATLAAEMNRAGFAVQAFGDYTGTPFDEDEDPQLIFQAVRQ